jgi:hypothetical protein
VCASVRGFQLAAALGKSRLGQYWPPCERWCLVLGGGTPWQLPPPLNMQPAPPFGYCYMVFWLLLAACYGRCTSIARAAVLLVVCGALAMTVV